MEGLSRRILLWSMTLTVVLALSFLLVCRLDPKSSQQLYQYRREAYEAALQLGHPADPPVPEFGRANLPPYLGRGRGELLLWFSLLAGLGTLAAWRLARPIDQALEKLAADCQRLERGEPGVETERGGSPGDITQDFARMLARLEQGQLELNQATGAAEAALRMREKLLDQSHAEFRQPLLSMLDSLKGLPEHAYLAIVERNLENLLQLTEDLGDGKSGPRMETVDLATFLSRALEVFPERVTLEPGAPVSLEIDPLRTSQALHNLVGNALKYSRQSVAVSWGQDWIEVRDQGPGMKEGEIPELLREFRQLEPGQGDGVGLGLATVERCMRLQGGRLELDSQPGQGTRARLQFTSDRNL